MTERPPPPPTAPAIQFQDLAQQQHAVRFGIWIFLGSELLLFAALFALYVGYRATYGPAFALAMQENDALLGTINTGILLISSFCAAWALHALRGGRARPAVGALAATIALGGVFLVVKGFEYADHFRHGIVPGAPVTPGDAVARGSHMFFTLYYLMTGLHALHILGGMAVLAWVALRVARRRTTPLHHPELEAGALYWHLVDAIWIFLWPLFYLTG